MALSVFNHKVSMFLVLCLLLITSSTESRRPAVTLAGSVKDTNGKAICNVVSGAEAGDTCDALRKDFALDFDFFLSINPNIDCDDIFVGQWICVDGSP